MANYPTIHKKNFSAKLVEAIEAEIAEGSSYSEAFAKVALSWLGYEDDRYLKRVDGAGDRAFDYYRILNNEVHVYQFKSQDITGKYDLGSRPIKLLA